MSISAIFPDILIFGLPNFGGLPFRLFMIPRYAQKFSIYECFLKMVSFLRWAAIFALDEACAYQNFN
jgi:hypothetical protein